MVRFLPRDSFSSARLRERLECLVPHVGFLAGHVAEELFSGRERLSAALDAACGLSHLHNMTPRQQVAEGSYTDRGHNYVWYRVSLHEHMWRLPLLVQLSRSRSLTERGELCIYNQE